MMTSINALLLSLFTASSSSLSRTLIITPLWPVVSLTPPIIQHQVRVRCPQPTTSARVARQFSLSPSRQQRQKRNLFNNNEGTVDADPNPNSGSNNKINLPPSAPLKTTAMTDLQNQLQTRTLFRIAVPSLSSALICFLTFPIATNTIFTYVQTAFDGVETGTGYEALNLILTDNSNQFIQNAHNFLALNFCFLTSFTFSFLYNNQVKLYNALFEEVSVLFSLIEQAALSTEGRGEIYKSILLSIRRYVNEDLKVVTNIGTTVNVITARSNHDVASDFGTTNDVSNNTVPTISNGENIASLHLPPSSTLTIAREDVPSFLVSQRPEHDPLETILYLTSVGKPSYIYSTVRSLRQARANRLASLQRKMPEINMYLLYILGFTAWVTFPIVTAGSSTVGGNALIEVYRDQLSLGMVGMGLVLGIINELKQPEVGSAYNVDYSVLGTLIDGLDKELNRRLLKCDSDVRNKSLDTAVDDLSGTSADATTKTTRRPRHFVKNLRDRAVDRIRARKEERKNNHTSNDNEKQLFKL